MRLNPDCTRDILLYFEEHTAANRILSFTAGSLKNQSDKLAKYTSDELMYHIEQCNAAGFFIGYSKDLTGNRMVHDISPKAHDFLANIREDSVWSKTKGVASKVGSTSLNALCQIASSVVTELIKSQLGL